MYLYKLSLIPQKLYAGSHWVMEIIQLLLNDAQPDKVDRSNIDTALEITLCNPGAQESNPQAIPGYKQAEGWKSPRVILTHCFEHLLPLQVWTKKPKVIKFYKSVSIVGNPTIFITMYFHVLKIWPLYHIKIDTKCSTGIRYDKHLTSGSEYHYIYSYHLMCIMQMNFSELLSLHPILNK